MKLSIDPEFLNAIGEYRAIIIESNVSINPTSGALKK